jgi:very-short-patch-repair endonuclease
MITKIRKWIYYKKKAMWRRSRILFPSPAEVRFVEIMGGRCLTIKSIRLSSTNFPLTIIVSFGRTLRREMVEREVQVGAYYVDFGFITGAGQQAIEIDGQNFHMDIVKEQERDEYLSRYGWRVLHIQAIDLYRKPDAVRERVVNFLAN